MKIAILSPVAWRTPPTHYGPWEQVSSNICEGMVNLGHDVTLFATGNSITKAKLESITKLGYEEDKSIEPKVVECLHISNIMEKAKEFDLIHNNFDFLPLTYTSGISTPMLTTIHGFSSKKIIPVYQKYNFKNNFYVSISNSDRAAELEYIDTVYNGINADEFTFSPEHGEYLLYFGRIHKDKGTHEAIKIALKFGMKLIISGLIQDNEYFENFVKPYIDNKKIMYVGNSGPEQRDKLLGGAYSLLHPINFEEPFGLSVAESMFCGTPVVAFNKGSMPELIVDKTTGLLVNSIEEAVSKLNLIKGINRLACRKWAEEKFSKEKMVKDYEQVYYKIVNGK